MDETRPFSKRLVPPPYTRSKDSKPEVIDNKPEGIQTGTNSPVQGEVAENLNAVPVSEGGEAKPRPRSVRTRQLNPPPGQDQGAESVKTNPRRTRLENPNRGLQILTAMDSDQKNAEEEEVDRLLIHYSTKKPSHEPPPAPPHQTAAAENNESSIASKPHPSRARSLQLEPTAPTDETRKVGHVRANSLQPDMKTSHVHPKLPNYDEVAALFATLRRK